MKNWNNLKDKRCPSCNSKLLFRLGGKSFRIKANHGKSKQKLPKENWYFCSRCDGFQISENRLFQIQDKIRDDEMKSIPDADKKLFEGGLLRL